MPQRTDTKAYIFFTQPPALFKVLEIMTVEVVTELKNKCGIPKDSISSVLVNILAH